VFFGTPHRGSKIAELAKILQRIKTVAFWNERPPIRLIQSLQFNSTELVALHNAWLGVCERYALVISCRECRPMCRKGLLRFVQAIAPMTQDLVSLKRPRFSKRLAHCLQVVDQFSASVGIEKENALPRQNCDHIDVCTFPDETGEEYLNLVHFIEQGLVPRNESSTEGPASPAHPTAGDVRGTLPRQSTEMTGNAIYH